jgi:hypothetical protein
MLKVIIPIITAVSLCLLLILLNITTPATAGPFGILAIFVFVYLLSFGLMTFFLYGMSRIIAHISAAFVVRRPLQGMTLRRSYFFSSVIAAAPVMLIALKSVGVIGIYEYLLVIFFVVIGCLYVSKRII